MGDFLGLFRGFLGNFGGVLVLNFFKISAKFSVGFLGSVVPMFVSRQCFADLFL